MYTYAIYTSYSIGFFFTTKQPPANSQRQCLHDVSYCPLWLLCLRAVGYSDWFRVVLPKRGSSFVSHRHVADLRCNKSDDCDNGDEAVQTLWYSREIDSAVQKRARSARSKWVRVYLNFGRYNYTHLSDRPHLIGHVNTIIIIIYRIERVLIYNYRTRIIYYYSL